MKRANVNGVNIFKCERLFLPINMGSHWTLLIINGTTTSIEYLDSLGGDGTRFFKPARDLLKAELGDKDENISPEKAREIIANPKIAARVEELSLQIYEAAAKHAESVGIVLADTKFEFGLDEKDEVVLVDEVLTPDSSRFWPQDTWEQNLGKAQPSFDKQFLRDWLTSNGLKGKEGVKVPEDIVQQTAAKYREACEKITSKSA